MIPIPGGSQDAEGQVVRDLLAEFLRGFSLRTLLFLLDMVLPQLDAYHAGRHLQHLQPWPAWNSCNSSCVGKQERACTLRIDTKAMQVSMSYSCTRMVPRSSCFVLQVTCLFFCSNALIALARSLCKCLLAVLITASEADAVTGFLVRGASQYDTIPRREKKNTATKPTQASNKTTKNKKQHKKAQKHHKKQNKLQVTCLTLLGSCTSLLHNADVYFC